MIERYVKCQRCGKMHDDGRWIDVDGGKVFVCLDCFDNHNAGNDARRVPCQRCGKLLDCMNLNDEGGEVMIDGVVTFVCCECLEYLDKHRETPRYKCGTKVMFDSVHGKNKVGVIEVVGFGGAWGANGHSYDIFVEIENMLYKHVPESKVTGFFLD